MKTFLEISDSCIINITKITTITKFETKVNSELKYGICYNLHDDYRNQFFNTQEERDLFFDDICNDLIYQ